MDLKTILNKTMQKKKRSNAVLAYHAALLKKQAGAFDVVDFLNKKLGGAKTLKNVQTALVDAWSRRS